MRRIERGDQQHPIELQRSACRVCRIEMSEMDRIERAAEDAEPIEGKIRLIAKQIDPQTHLQSVAVSLPKDADLPIGTFVIGAFAVSFGLIVYDSWFLRKTRTLR